MRGALIHGILLAVMLVYGYRTWTRDKTILPDIGNVVLWSKSENDIKSIEYRSPKKIVKIERKPEGYWWGVDTTIETKARPQAPKPNAGSGSAGSGSAGSGSAGSGSGAGSGSAAAEVVTIEEDETGQKTREFPLGEAGDKLIKSYADARALRDLGKPNDAAKKDYKLGTKPANIVYGKDGKPVSATTVTVNFTDGSSRSFTIGGPVYGGSDKYAVDDKSGKAYVLSKDLLSGLEIGETTLHLVDPRGFDAAKIGSVTIEANGKSKTVARIQTDSGSDGGQQVKTWGDPKTKKGDQTAANFVDNANNLRPTEYASNVKLSELTPVMKMTYKDERGSLLGTMQLFKREKPGQLAEGQELDPANPPKGETEYYILTEKTRVPAIVRKDTAARAEGDIETVFSGKQPEPKSAIEPHGNPFGSPGPGGAGGPPGGPPPGLGAPGGAPPPPGLGPPGGAPPHGSGAAIPPPPKGAGSAAAPKGPAAPKPPAPKPAAPSKAPAPAPAPGGTPG